MSLKQYLLTTGFLLFTLASFGQDQTVTGLKKAANAGKELPKNDTAKNWTTGGIFNINIGQGSQKNWAAGGDDFSFSLNSYFGLWARYKKDKISWDNSANFNYGILNTTSQKTRKNDDRIDLSSKVGYALSKKLNAAFLANFQSQFSKGYSYKSDGSKEYLSNFMAPGYLLLSIGLDYRPADGLSIFFSPITTRWVFVHDDILSAAGAYGVAPGKKMKSELGAFASVNYQKKFTDKITYLGKLDLFSNYKHNPQNIDLMMTNMATFKVSKVFGFNVGLDLIYDDDVKLFGPTNSSPGLQIKEVIGAGLTLNL
ncbi:MAG: DUF3078 domain-containing protein [Chitinophagaceae bacterium]|nr:DUF3078 domain-containing protein [Chitinophagaceae bacterium]